MKERLKYIIKYFGLDWVGMSKITGNTPATFKTMMSTEPIPRAYAFAIYVFDKMEEENRELEWDVRYLKRQIELLKNKR